MAPAERRPDQQLELFHNFNSSEGIITTKGEDTCLPLGPHNTAFDHSFLNVTRELGSSLLHLPRAIVSRRETSNDTIPG